MCERSIESVPEHWLRAIDPGGHLRILRAASGEEECDFSRPSGCADEIGAGRGAQPMHSLDNARADNRPPMRQRLSSGLKREGHVGEIEVSRRFERRREVCAHTIEGRGRLRREDDQLTRARSWFRSRGRRCLLDDHVTVGASSPQRGDSGASSAAVRRPIAQRRVHEERTGVEVDARIGRSK